VDIKVRVTPEQRAEIAAAARALGLTMTDYMAFKSLGDAREQEQMQRMDAHMNATATALADAVAAHRHAIIGALGAIRSEVIAQGDRTKGNLEKLAAAMLHRQQS
jgi:hypothetical protein